MRILFFGMPITGAPFLRGILDDGRYLVVGIVVPDVRKASGRHGSRAWYHSMRATLRGIRPKPGTTEWIARREHLPIWRHNLNSIEFNQYVSLLKPDSFVVASFNRILKQPVLDLAPRGVLNVHPSLLPKYRGADPIYWVILNGEQQTGVTVHFMEASVDTGPILGQRSLSIPEGIDSVDLIKNLSDLGVILLLETLDRLEANTISPWIQDEQAASYYSPATETVRTIDWQCTSDHILRMVRASTYLGGARAQLDGQWVFVLQAEVVSDAAGHKPGMLLSPAVNNKAYVACLDAILRTTFKPASNPHFTNVALAITFSNGIRKIRLPF